MKIGSYSLGVRTVRLFGRSGQGGNFDSGDSTIYIGLDDDWPSVVSAFIHEAFEMVSSDSGYRFRQSPDCARDNGASLFVMDHTQMSETIGRVGHFVSDALPDVAKAYNARKRRRKA